MSQIERMQKGVKIALADLNKVNIHLNGVLYGIISAALDAPEVAPLAKPERLLIPVIDASKTKSVRLARYREWPCIDIDKHGHAAIHDVRFTSTPATCARYHPSLSTPNTRPDR